MRIAVVENAPLTQHGQVGVALNEAGAVLDVFRPFVDGRLPDGREGHAGLVVFGGGQSALDDARHPYLPALAEMMRDWTAAGLPVLGICLGAQLLARGFGAANRLGLAREFGWREVVRADQGADDPVFAAVPARFHSFQWHADTFDLPAGAVGLASAAGVAMQAFRIGRRGWGTQFHFEANRAVIGQWCRLQGDEIAAFAPGWIEGARAAEEVAHGAAADAAGLALARGWVAQI